MSPFFQPACFSFGANLPLWSVQQWSTVAQYPKTIKGSRVLKSCAAMMSFQIAGIVMLFTFNTIGVGILFSF
jgi:hypothetical protein